MTAKLIFGMNQSLDGYVDHTDFAPDAVLFRHYIEQARERAGSIYGRKIYELMAYWDEDRPEWDSDRRAFAEAWRRQHKWVASRSTPPLGPNASLVEGDLATAVQAIKAAHDGEISVAGTGLAHSLGALDLIDEYQIYLHPVVLGRGTPLFAGPRPRLRLVGQELIGPEVIRLRYVPA